MKWPRWERWLLYINLMACGHRASSPDAGLPSCSDLGCPGPVLCTQHDVCTCHGERCTPVVDGGVSGD